VVICLIVDSLVTGFELPSFINRSANVRSVGIAVPIADGVGG